MIYCIGFEVDETEEPQWVKLVGVSEQSDSGFEQRDKGLGNP